MPTLEDVAARCGVSTATVSAVVNGAAWVSDPTRARVEKAIEETGYRPNRVARSLKTSQGYGVGVIVHDLTNPFFTEVVRSLSHALRELGRTLFLCDADRQFDVGAQNLQMLLENQVDGLVLINDVVRDETLRSELRGIRAPVVSIDRTYDDLEDAVHHLLVDSEQGAYEATSHLIEQGRQRVALVSGALEGPDATGYGRLERYRGYRRALEEAGLAFDPDLFAKANFHYDGGRRAGEKLLALDRPPDAIFCANDLMALGALRAAQESGRAVPEDLAVAGFDDIPMARHVSPALTTIAMPKREMGRAAAELLHELIEGQRASSDGPALDGHALDGHSQDGHAATRRMFDAELVVRASSQPRVATAA